ncbi:MAG: aminotransferase class V-fold PLP-dependent enzyme [Nanoarchaeota archaeon]
MEKIYFFDNYQTTPLSEKVKEAIKNELNNWLLPYRFIKQGVERQKLIDESKETILKSLNNIDDYNISFVNDGALANALIIKSVVKKLKKKNPNIELITEKISCPSIISTYKELEKEGIKVHYISVDNKGNINLKELKEKLNENTALVSITHINHITGTIQNAEEIYKIVKNNSNALIHLNAQWSYLKVPIDLKSYKFDFLTISAYKIHGPMISSIIWKENANYENILIGKSFESLDKYPNIPYIAGFKVAVEEKMENNQWKKDNEKMKELRNYLWKLISENIDETELIGPNLNENRDVANLLVLFKRIEGESIYYDLSFDNIIVSTTSACAHENLQANYVILALGKRHEDSHGSLRFTFSKMNTKEEVDFLFEKLKASVKRIRKITAYTPDYDYEKIKKKQ